MYPTPNTDMMSLLLIGITGGGKSELGNRCVGYSAFEASASQDSVTKYTQIAQGNCYGHLIRVIDTPGID